MHKVYVHVCDKCGFTVETSGLWEFYRDSNGKFKSYGHPIPNSIEAEESGIYGLYGIYYCVDCGKNSQNIVFESKFPVFEKTALWNVRLEPISPYGDGFRPVCEHCGSKRIFLHPAKVPCPKCKEGYLKGREK